MPMFWHTLCAASQKRSKPAEKAAVQEIVTISGRDTGRKSRALPCEYA